jgi:hypothetical protein
MQKAMSEKGLRKLLDYLKEQLGGKQDVPKNGLNMNNKRVFNVSDPEEPQDVATRKYVDDIVGDIESLLKAV